MSSWIAQRTAWNPGCRTIMKFIQGEGRPDPTVHVDDIIFVCRSGDVACFSNSSRKDVDKEGRWLSSSSRRRFLHFKKKPTLLPERTMVQPSNTYTFQSFFNLPRFVVEEDVAYLTMPPWNRTIQILSSKARVCKVNQHCCLDRPFVRFVSLH